jgi:hypothetical protein
VASCEGPGHAASMGCGEVRVVRIIALVRRQMRGES